MKNRLFQILGKSALPTLLAGAVLAFSSPASALAAGRGGGGHAGGFSGGARSGFSGGARGFSGGGFSGGGRAYAAPRGGYYGGYRGGGYYGGGGVYLGLGAGVPYGYGYGYAPAAPCGFYDQAGFWHPAPCTVPGY